MTVKSIIKVAKSIIDGDLMSMFRKCTGYDIKRITDFIMDDNIDNLLMYINNRAFDKHFANFIFYICMYEARYVMLQEFVKWYTYNTRGKKCAYTDLPIYKKIMRSCKKERHIIQLSVSIEQAAISNIFEYCGI